MKRKNHLLINKNQAKHWSAETPLVSTVLKQDNLEQGLQYLRKADSWISETNLS